MYRTEVPNAFEFVVVAGLRVRQLVRGCTARVAGNHKKTVLAQHEVLAGKVGRSDVARIDVPIGSIV